MPSTAKVRLAGCRSENEILRVLRDRKASTQRARSVSASSVSSFLPTEDTEGRSRAPCSLWVLLCALCVKIFFLDERAGAVKQGHGSHHRRSHPSLSGAGPRIAGGGLRGML